MSQPSSAPRPKNHESPEPRPSALAAVEGGYVEPPESSTSVDVEPPTIDTDRPELYVNRELSQLEFFRRVLAQAGRSEVPVLERLRFLTICSTIVDEFFEIRVAGLRQRAQLGLDRQGPDGLTATDALDSIAHAVRTLMNEQYRLLNLEVLPALATQGIRILKRSAWNTRQRAWVEGYFETQVAPVLTPVGLDPAHPFPRVLNKSLNMFVALEGRDAFGRASDFAVLSVPRCLPRVIPLPQHVSESQHDFVLLSSVVHAHVDQAFPGMKVMGCHQFRVTRNADLWVEEEEVEDLLDALKGQLHHRRFGDAVRIEVAAHCPKEHIAFLLQHFRLKQSEVYPVDGPVNLHRLGTLYDLVDRPDLKYPRFTPGLRGMTALGTNDMFEVLSRGDVLLHHPYESFSPVVDLVRQAAADPQVLAIKQTVYRTGDRSPVVEALADAARAGKEVTAVIELRARFDEAHNIRLATSLQEAGAHVVYGVVGYKTHAKMMLIVRREGGPINGRLKRYVHLGTGNYHTGTARTYTDFSYLTARDDIGADVHHVFMQLTGLGRAEKLACLFQSPFSLHSHLMACINREIEEARAGRTARIIFKINSLQDPTMIAALYRAASAGVSIDLIVRGICCLRPGLPGVSETIRVRSVVGRFLEHSRVFFFHARGAARVYLSSADLMGRNLYRRVEVCFPVLEPTLKQRVITEALETYLTDPAGAWEMERDGTYLPVVSSDEAPQSAQERLLGQLGES